MMFIALIYKTNAPRFVTNFSLITLYDVCYKGIVKILQIS